MILPSVARWLAGTWLRNGAEASEAAGRMLAEAEPKPVAAEPAPVAETVMEPVEPADLVACVREASGRCDCVRCRVADPVRAARERLTQVHDEEPAPAPEAALHLGGAVWAALASRPTPTAFERSSRGMEAAELVWLERLAVETGRGVSPWDAAVRVFGHKPVKPPP